MVTSRQLVFLAWGSCFSESTEINYPGLFFLPGAPASVRGQEIGNPGLSRWGDVVVASKVFNVAFLLQFTSSEHS